MLNVFPFRKRKKEQIKENVIKNLEAPINKPLIKVKAKDSDDEDYMAWKKPENAPIVTFTPPPDTRSLRYKANILTKKHLESFNARLNQQINIARAMFADGDDGFESLNGNDNNSNASDNDNKKKTEATNAEEKTVKVSKDKPLTEKVTNDVKADELKGNLKKDDNEKSDQDSEGAIPMSSPSSGKRVGVRFRGKWSRDSTHHESSDELSENIKKKEVRLLYHSKYFFKYILLRSGHCCIPSI